MNMKKDNPAGQGKADPSQGIELDTVDLSELLGEKTQARHKGPSRSSPKKSGPVPGRRHGLLLAGGGVALVILGVAVFCWQHPQIQLNFRRVPATSVGGAGRYVDIGPLHLSLGTEQNVKMAFKIACQDQESQEALSRMGPLIRSQLIALLASPEAEPLLKKRDYGQLRRLLKERLAQVAPEQAEIEEVFFTEILVY